MLLTSRCYKNKKGQWLCCWRGMFGLWHVCAAFAEGLGLSIYLGINIRLWRLLRCLVAWTTRVCSRAGIWCLLTWPSLTDVVLQCKCCTLCTKQIVYLRAKHSHMHPNGPYNSPDLASSLRSFFPVINAETVGCK